jgi:hypothetical protein
MITNVFPFDRREVSACGAQRMAQQPDDDPGLQIAILDADHIDCDSVERRDSVSKGITWTHWT